MTPEAALSIITAAFFLAILAEAHRERHRPLSRLAPRVERAVRKLSESKQAQVIEIEQVYGKAE